MEKLDIFGSDEEVEIDDLAKTIAKFFKVRVYFSQARIEKLDRYVPSIEKAISSGMNLDYSLEEAINANIEKLNQ